MKKKNVKWVVGIGLLSIMLCFVSVWYAITFNDSRLVVPMDFSAYQFIAKDIPIIASVIFFSLYVVGLFCWLVYSIFKKSQENKISQKTRKLNPKWGWLGFLGILGFAGFWTYSIDKTIFPFCFFSFFGFFGFFYEGRMSGTFMDERFKENALKAQLKSLKIGFIITWIILLFLGQGKLIGNLEYTAIAFTIVLSIDIAVTLFLSEYLLYQYDHDELNEE